MKTEIKLALANKAVKKGLLLSLAGGLLLASCDNKEQTVPGPTVQVNTMSANEKDSVYNAVQVKPIFNGDLIKFLADNIKYPETARDKNISGTVYVKFVITKNGDVTNAEILRSVDKQLDSTALSVVNMMPHWTPGQQNGKAVNVAYMLPIKFILK